MFRRHKHRFTYPSGREQEPLVVSGYGLTEYELLFCIDCGEIVWRLTKDIEHLYPRLTPKERIMEKAIKRNLLGGVE